MGREYSIYDMVQHTKCPVMKVERMKFMRIVDLTGLSGENAALRFEYDVHWLRESRTKSVLRTRHGDMITEGSSYNDYYGFLTSVREDEFAAREWAKTRDLKPGGDIIAETIVTITDTPVVVPSDRVIKGSTSGRVHPNAFLYVGIPDDWMLDDELAQARLDGFNAPPDGKFTLYEVNRLEASETQVVIWSSDNTDEQNAASLASLDQYRAGIGKPETMQRLDPTAVSTASKLPPLESEQKHGLNARWEGDEDLD